MQKHTTLQALRFVGAAAVLGTGAVHLQQYLGADYHSIPTIGPLFLLNAIGCGIVGIALLLPIERTLAGRRADMWVAALAIAAVAIAVGSLVALFISETGALFGFSEDGYRPAIVVAIITEALTVLSLSPVAGITVHRALSRRRDRDARAGTERAWARPQQAARS